MDDNGTTVMVLYAPMVLYDSSGLTIRLGFQEFIFIYSIAASDIFHIISS